MTTAKPRHKQLRHPDWRGNTMGYRFGDWLGPGAAVYALPSGWGWQILLPLSGWSKLVAGIEDVEAAKQDAEDALREHGVWWADPEEVTGG